jgi:hypothetical protein
LCCVAKFSLGITVLLCRRNAREVAEKFAADSNSKLGKIRQARQGQFSISARDKNSPSIKKVRVVSTVALLV